MSIEKQLELEQAMIDSGAANYLKNQREAEADGKGADLDYSNRLMREFVLPLTTELQAWLDTKSKFATQLGRAKTLLRLLPAETSIFLALRSLFNSFTIERSIAALAASIGRMVEDEVRFSRFQEKHQEYYNTLIADFKRKNTKSYRHMQQVLVNKANEKNDEWTSWTPAEKIDVGTRLLNIILEHTDLIEKVERRHAGRPVTEIVPTQSAMDWIKKHEDMKQFMYPERAPCIIPPDEWTAVNQGGYYSPVLRQSVPMVKTTISRKVLDEADLSKVMASINKVQSVAWEVNKEVLAVMKEVWHKNLGIGMPPSEKLKPGPCPVDGIPADQMTEQQKQDFQDWKFEASAIYTAERERVSQTFQVTRVIRMANDYAAYDAFWYVWYADFRGRLYTATAGFSPQGPDLAKGLLRFKRGKKLGERGLYWLKVHGANRYGYDKDTYDGRVAWVDQRHDEFIRAAADPLSYRETWANADKPWQFLAFLFEYANAHALASAGIGPTEYVSHLAVGLDGSCNGLQNFSAMLRDPIGGAATNLTPGKKPSDIYAQVAQVTVRKVTEFISREMNRVFDRADFSSDDAYQGAMLDHNTNMSIARSWMSFGIDRKLCKRPVMTLPYGATRQSCQQYLFQEILARNKEHFAKGKNFKAATWLTGFVWAAIGEVVVAAAQAMSWLQKCATAMNKIDKPIQWTTADGFIAYQHSKVIETVQITTQLQGRFQVRVGTITDEIDGNKQRMGVSPNFVHSQDATHLRMTVLNAVKAGIDDLMLIHDDYGTHAADTEALHKVIRETFVELYAENDPLEAFAAACREAGATLPPLPSKGSLNLLDVLVSLYFFG